jgi:hypothetical protein
MRLWGAGGLPRRPVVLAGVAGLTLVLLFPILLVLWHNINASLIGSTGDDSTWRIARLQDPYAGGIRSPLNVLKTGPKHSNVFCVRLLLQRVQPAGPRLSGVVLVTPTRTIKQQVKEDVRLQRYRPQDSFRLQLEDRLGLGDTTLQVPVEAMLRERNPPDSCAPVSESDSTWQKTIDVPVFGQPRAYPNDTYAMSKYAVMYGPETTDGEGLAGCCPGISVELASGNEDLRIDIAQSPASIDWFLPLESTVRRPVRVIWFSYELAAVPLALIALLGYQLIRSRRRGRLAPSHEITFEVAAILLALLPLRQVLVPSDVVGLTFIDTIFGLEIVLLIAGALWWSVLAAQDDHQDVPQVGQGQPDGQ